MDEAALHVQLRAGDHHAWRQVLEEHSPKLLGYAGRLLGDTVLAEEVVQEALLDAYRSIRRFEGRSSFRSWLFRVVRNRALDELRRRKRLVFSSDDDPELDTFRADGTWAEPLPKWEEGVGDQIDARALIKIVAKELDKLPHNHREVMILKEIQGMSTEEICQTLDISSGNLRVRLHRARQALLAAVSYNLAEG